MESLGGCRLIKGIGLDGAWEGDGEIVAQSVDNDDDGFGEGFGVPAAGFWRAGAFEGVEGGNWGEGAGGF